MRSWLFIEGNSPGKMAKAPMVGADAIVVDMSCVAMDDEAPQVRAEVVEWLRAYNDPLIAKKAFARWVRLKPLDTPLWREELAVLMQGAPEGVILPKAIGNEQIRVLASELYEIEQKLGLKHNSTKIIPQVGETPQAALTLHELSGDRQPRLNGFAWNADAVARGLGAKRTRSDDGRWTDALSHVRAMTLILARSIGVMAIDTATRDYRDLEQGRRDARSAKQDGFHGICALHPGQIPVIHEAYSLSAKERAEAEAVIGLFNSRSVAELLAEADGNASEEAPPEEMAPRQGIRSLG